MSLLWGTAHFCQSQAGEEKHVFCICGRYYMRRSMLTVDQTFTMRSRHELSELIYTSKVIFLFYS